MTWRLADVTGDRDALVIERDRAQDAAAVARASLAMRSQQYGDLVEAMGQREARLEQSERTIADHRAAARQLEDDDDATRDWADSPVPAGVRQWVRDLAAGTDAGDDMPGSAGVHDRAEASPDQGGHP
ncbi:hypothetical protein [Halomonas organivorans]|uniref:hypothetical protein n=1 Tax=Halomonas organivorans TaxID=257772 RepID=UPI00160EEC81|nr:hypothetical protein [Halomonas organivorans]